MVLGASALAEGSLEEGGCDVSWLPYHQFEINSPLPLASALDAIRTRTEPVKWFRWRWPSSRNDDRFEGEVTNNGFTVRRIIGYRNSFLPEITGAIAAAGRGSRIVITMKPHALVIVFAALWCAGVIAAAIATLNYDPRFVWLPLLMLVFLYLMVMGGFWFEANKQEPVLRHIFQGGYT
jgi:hypothetical protein